MKRFFFIILILILPIRISTRAADPIPLLQIEGLKLHTTITAYTNVGQVVSARASSGIPIAWTWVTNVHFRTNAELSWQLRYENLSSNRYAVVVHHSGDGRAWTQGSGESTGPISGSGQLAGTYVISGLTNHLELWSFSFLALTP